MAQTKRDKWVFFQTRTKTKVLSQRNCEGRDILRSVKEITMVTSEEEALQMLLKQYPGRHPGKWAFIQRILLLITKALTIPNNSLNSFVQFILVLQVFRLFQSQIITIRTSNLHLYSAALSCTDTSVNEIRKWPEAPELITQASEK